MPVDENHLQEEQAAFDQQTRDRMANGFVPDLRRLEEVDWFYNNVWRDPRYVKIHWMPKIDFILDGARSRGGRVLEIGCGLGMLALELAREGMDVTGVDLSPDSIEVAERYKDENPFVDGMGNLTYRCEDVMKLEFEPESFDSVVFFRSLHHMPELKPLLAHVHRWLKDDGNLLVSEPIRSHFDEKSAIVASAFRMLAPTWQSYQEKLAGDWTPERLEKLFSGIHTEYALEDDHEQSPFDNSTDSAEDILAALEGIFDVQQVVYSDAFIDKLIGGLRGEAAVELAQFLKTLDDYMVKTGFLAPTSLELCATKRA